MMKKIIIALCSFTLIHSYDTYKDLLDNPYDKKNDVYKFEDNDVILYRSVLYKDHIFGRKKSDKSLIAYMPTSTGSIRILEKENNKYSFREESPTRPSTKLDIDTSAFERYVESSFNDEEQIFENGERKEIFTNDFSLSEK
jgi:hypothetical protein